MLDYLDENRKDFMTNIFTLGVRSACRNTVTLAFSVHMGASWLVPPGPRAGLSIEVERRIQKAARMSAALSTGLSEDGQSRRSEGDQVLAIVSFIAFNKAPSININDLTSRTIIATEHIEPTDTLAKTVTYFIRP